jgi:hypothetical protein
MITAMRSRIAHLITVVSVALTAFGAAAIYAPAAFARVDPDGPYPYPATMPAPSAAVTAHASSGSGLPTWLIVVLAVALIAVVAALVEGARSVWRNRQAPRTVAVAS